MYIDLFAMSYFHIFSCPFFLKTALKPPDSVTVTSWGVVVWHVILESILFSDHDENGRFIGIETRWDFRMMNVLRGVDVAQA